jgi:mono/diheme cytochrome c family protein
MRMPYPALIAALLTTGPTAAPAQIGGDLPGDPAAGRTLAEQVCWACHVIPDYEPPTFEAPGAQPFEELAADSAVTGMALHAFLRSSHPTMPNFVFSDEELTNIIAYILSLRDG